MMNNELRRMFETVLTAPPPDTADIDAAVRAGRRRRHWRTAAALLSSAAVVAAIGVTTAVLLPAGQRQPAASQAVSNAPAEGTIVTDARQILGTWQTTELDGQNVRAVRDGSDQPLEVRFEQTDGQLRWGANDDVNYHSGALSVSREGRFRADKGTVTLVGTVGHGPAYLRNPEAVEQATQARLVAASPTGPATLLLLANGRTIAVYART